MSGGGAGPQPHSRGGLGRLPEGGASPRERRPGRERELLVQVPWDKNAFFSE